MSRILSLSNYLAQRVCVHNMYTYTNQQRNHDLHVLLIYVNSLSVLVDRWIYEKSIIRNGTAETHRHAYAHTNIHTSPHTTYQAHQIKNRNTYIHVLYIREYTETHMYVNKQGQIQKSSKMRKSIIKFFDCFLSDLIKKFSENFSFLRKSKPKVDRQKPPKKSKKRKFCTLGTQMPLAVHAWRFSGFFWFHFFQQF